MKSNHGTQPPSRIPEGYLWLGQVGRPHGVRGAFFLKTEDHRTDWPGYSQILLMESDGQTRILKVQKAYVSGGKLALQSENVNGREACERIYNAHLFVARGDIETNEDEYIVGELVGCQVEVEGRPGIFGTVLAVHNFGAQETLEIAKNGSQETIFYPFLNDYILTIEESRKLIIVKDESVFLDGHES
jgi:16S rRNA processing protein RimM